MRHPKSVVKDSELIPDLLETKPEQVSYIESTVIVDGIPIVGSAKSTLLQNVILKKFSVIGQIIQSEIPLDSKDQTKGYMFITYENISHASKAVKELNNTALDKAHTFIVSLFSDFDKSVNISDEWKPPEQKPYTDIGSLRNWLLNDFCRNQFALVENNGNQCSVYWHAASEAIPIEQRVDWSEGWIKWSSHGTYLATMHLQGVILWGGDKFQRISRFAHKDVRVIDFSPRDKFMVSLSPNEDESKSSAEVFVWDICKGLACRNFTVNFSSWPVFKWSQDDAYFATLQSGSIYIYETKTFTMLDKKPLKSNVDISDFAWSPTENILSYWVSETSNSPARVTVISIPNRKELCNKNLFSVAEISLIWHPQGDFLAVQVLHCNKKKVDNDNQVKYMGTFVNFEIVRMREKLYPVDQLAIKDSVSNFQWEPHGNRFAFVSCSPSGSASIPIYELTKGGKVREISIVHRETSRINELRWSPKGHVFVIANLKSADASLEFIDANDSATLSKVEHAMASELHWDTTGRYLASVVSSFSQKSDNAVWFWNCVGRALYQLPVNGLRIFTWRPFPPTLLTSEQVQSVKKNLTNKYSTQFENEDKMLASKASRELMDRRREQMAEFDAWRNKLLSISLTNAEKRKLLRDISDESVETEAEEELYFIVSTSRESMQCVS